MGFLVGWLLVLASFLLALLFFELSLPFQSLLLFAFSVALFFLQSEARLFFLREQSVVLSHDLSVALGVDHIGRQSDHRVGERELLGVQQRPVDHFERSRRLDYLGHEAAGPLGEDVAQLADDEDLPEVVADCLQEHELLLRHVSAEDQDGSVAAVFEELRCERDALEGLLAEDEEVWSDVHVAHAESVAEVRVVVEPVDLAVLREGLREPLHVAEHAPVPGFSAIERYRLVAEFDRKETDVFEEQDGLVRVVLVLELVRPVRYLEALLEHQLRL